MAIKSGKLFNGDQSDCIIRELFNKSNSNLEYLSQMEVLMRAQSYSPVLSFKTEEALVFNLEDPVELEVEGKRYRLEPYDVLYIPINTSFRLHHTGDEEGWLYIYRAVGEESYPVYHAKWTEVKETEERIRRLNKKDVFLMFDVGEKANKFIAGYTFYETYTRAWPPHNHTDQEEVYSFIDGRGAMEVYEDDEHKTFVTTVETGDNITIPMLNYHPVFSHEEPLTFIWCIAGERYWVGDKNKDFMKGKGEHITT
jgi:mannose-6-phosphate isomerase-like protein (cupin superfamily)